eukprot:6771856-Ditylum_brightwellii.AAC.1
MAEKLFQELVATIIKDKLIKLMDIPNKWKMFLKVNFNPVDHPHPDNYCIIIGPQDTQWELELLNASPYLIQCTEHITSFCLISTKQNLKNASLAFMGYNENLLENSECTNFMWLMCHIPTSFFRSPTIMVNLNHLTIWTATAS